MGDMKTLHSVCVCNGDHNTLDSFTLTLHAQVVQRYIPYAFSERALVRQWYIHAARVNYARGAHTIDTPWNTAPLAHAA